MRKSNHWAIRRLLRGSPDGMRTPDIAASVGVVPKSASDALRAMPDAYIDRWDTTKPGPPAAVWCVVVPPENCPRPERRRRKE